MVDENVCGFHSSYRVIGGIVEHAVPLRSDIRHGIRWGDRLVGGVWCLCRGDGGRTSVDGGTVCIPSHAPSSLVI